MELAGVQERIGRIPDRLRAAPGGRVRAKIKAEWEQLLARQEQLRGRIEELQLRLPPVVPPKPVVPPDGIPTIEQILKQHFGWTRPRAEQELLHIKVSRVPDTATIRRERPGWTTAFAEKERQRRIRAILAEHSGVQPRPETLKLMDGARPAPPPIKKVTPPVKDAGPAPRPAPAPAPAPGPARWEDRGLPIRERIAAYRASREAELAKWAPQEIVSHAVRIDLDVAVALDPSLAEKYPRLFKLSERSRYNPDSGLLENRWGYGPVLRVVRDAEAEQLLADAEQVLKAHDRAGAVLNSDGRFRMPRFVTHVDDAIGRAIAKWLEVPKAERIGLQWTKLTGYRGIHDPLDATVTKAAAWYEKVVTKKAIRNWQSGLPINFRTSTESAKRAFFRSRDNAVFIGGKQSTRVTVHEVGHGYENNMRGWQRMAIEFRDRRGRDTGDGQLTTIYKGTDEVGFKDEFISHYMGKVYGHADTEIISMGLEMLYAEPATLFAKDPEYFWFMVGLVKGDIVG